MFQLTQYANAKSPQVQQVVTLESVLQTIKNRDDENLILIQSARALGKGHPKYDTIKTTLLPTYRFNFLFDGSASNDNITTATGLIYLDADNLDEIPDNPYILASWKSLSDTGFGILAKVDNLTKSNHGDVYDQLSELIGITSDAGARKATQQTILSHDPNLYYNPNSLVFHFQDKVSYAPILEKKEKCIGTCDTCGNWNEDAIRFNNISDYFTDDTPYLVFQEKIKICNPFIPLRIEEGKRNSTMFFLLSQYALLNPKAGRPFLKSIGESINNHMSPHISDRELNAVVDSVLRKRDEGTLTIHYNEERRILFNPKAQLAPKEKTAIVNRELGRLKSDITRELIQTVLECWDSEAEGAITQKKVSLLAGRGIATIKRHWSEFKDSLQEVNNAFLSREGIAVDEPRPKGIPVEEYIFNMRCKFTTMEPSDEKFLRETFKSRSITHAGDAGFDEIHQWMYGLLKSRQQLYRVA